MMWDHWGVELRVNVFNEEGETEKQGLSMT